MVSSAPGGEHRLKPRDIVLGTYLALQRDVRIGRGYITT